MYYFYWRFLKELPKAALFLCFICIQLFGFLNRDSERIPRSLLQGNLQFILPIPEREPFSCVTHLLRYHPVYCYGFEKFT